MLFGVTLVQTEEKWGFENFCDSLYFTRTVLLTRQEHYYFSRDYSA